RKIEGQCQLVHAVEDEDLAVSQTQAARLMQDRVSGLIHAQRENHQGYGAQPTALGQVDRGGHRCPSLSTVARQPTICTTLLPISAQAPHQAAESRTSKQSIRLGAARQASTM
ncbi:MAG: hypothetical protein WAU59_17825, partial [Rhodoplanes sp.]